jgi:NADH-quinone oxidoreductase subunit M
MEGILLVLIVTFPLFMAMAMLFVPGRYVKIWRGAALFVALAELIFTGIAYVSFTHGHPLEIQLPWLMLSFGAFGSLKVDFHLQADGLNLSLVVLSSLVFFVSTLSSFDIKKYTKGYYLLIFLLSTSVLGCFLSHDFLLFFLFFEFMLLPMYFLVGIWGGERREYAAIKFFLYTLLGSVFILLVLIATYSSVFHPQETGNNLSLTHVEELKRAIREDQGNKISIVHTLDYDYIFQSSYYIPGSVLDRDTHFMVMGWEIRSLLFFLFLLGFAIKLPVVPVHTWLPDAHVEAPTSVSVILAGVLLKIGGYGIIQLVLPLFPDLALQHAFWIASFGVISMLYGGMNALAQTDLKKLIAYSSVSHMGYVMLGIGSHTQEGLNGAMFQMLSHGILSSLLFLLAGVLYERTHDRTISHYRGLASHMPYYAAISSIAFFSALGLPVFSGFIAEISVYMGAFLGVTTGTLPLWLVMTSLLSLLVGAAYCLWTLQRIFFGVYWIKPSLSSFLMPDLSIREWCMLVPLVFLTILLGVYPQLAFDLFKNFHS